MTKEQKPRTLEEWGRALDAADALLWLDSVRSPGADPDRDWPRIDREACERVLAEGRERGMYPHDDALERYVDERRRRGISPNPDADLRGIAPGK